MGLIHHTKKVVGRALDPTRAGARKIAIRKLGVENLASMRVESPDFVAGAELPRSATVDGAGDSPTIRWDNVPPGTKSFVLVCEDPDAPLPEPFVHWLVYGIPAHARAVDRAAGHVGKDGMNSTLGTGFTPVAPPPGHGTHHYHFQIFALDCPLELRPDTGRGALFEAMRGHVLACGDIAGAYERG